MLKFTLIGAGGFVAPRHMAAIKDTGNDLVAIFDPKDSVGVIDKFFPESKYFSEFERYDRYVDRVLNDPLQKSIAFTVVCSPNYLHDSHIRHGLRNLCDVICEKPLVLNSWNLDTLAELENKTGKQVWNILQLRLHPTILQLKRELISQNLEKKYDVSLTYITARGSWYLQSWKGDLAKSGGITTNIGIHFFDMLIHLFGAVESYQMHRHSETEAAGFLELKNARVRWFMSIDKNDLPKNIPKTGAQTYRSLTLNGNEVLFSDGFEDLHLACYKEILKGNGFGLNDARPAIELVGALRNQIPVYSADAHPMVNFRD